jgi:hypothetical protein
MPKFSSVGIAATFSRPGQASLSMITQEDEADILLSEALNEILTVEVGSTRYNDLLDIIAINKSVAASADFFENIIESTIAIVEEKAELVAAVEVLEETIASGDFVATTNKFAMALKADVEANAVLDIRYLLYMQKYGPPVDGMFDPVLLAEFIDPGA